MDGVFMKRIFKRLLFLSVLVCCFYTGALLADKEMLHDELIRLHVVAASDSAEDQAIKLKVRDAVIASLQQAMSDATDVNQAKEYIQDHLPQIEAAANAVLKELGSKDLATVSFMEEAFPVREYDTFSLPSGVYESLRITIGEGQGKNWWCVVFPSLCFQASSSDVEHVAAGAGFSDGLSNAVTQQQGYRVRFYFLDMLGRLENFFFGD
jgi:stage II sporulation protein R